MEKKKSINTIGNVIMALCASMMLCMKFVPIDHEIENGYIVEDIFYNLSISMKGMSLLSTVLFFSIFIVGRKCKEIQLSNKILFQTLSVMISGIWLSGECFRIDNRLYNAIKSPGQVVKSMIYFSGGVFNLYRI